MHLECLNNRFQDQSLAEKKKGLKLIKSLMGKKRILQYLHSPVDKPERN
jgi:hypothetical protein